MWLLMWLLSPDTPLWAKIVVSTIALTVAIIAVLAWWKEDFWHSLNSPDEKPDRRQARPPF